jgi:5-methylcytosine-specific restriction endonuclease McrA
MNPPTAEEQLKFLMNVQRLLAEGQFTATYKYALLLSLADIAVEVGDHSGESVEVPTELIAEKFIQYYWRQYVPYLPWNDPALDQVLKQNTGRQAAIIRQVIEARKEHGGSIIDAQQDQQGWTALLQRVDQVVRQMPLWKLQTVGGSQFDFIYPNLEVGTSIELRPSVAYCLRQFHGLIGDLVRGAWVRYIRRHNHDALGTTADLSEFLFGTERSDLSVVREILDEVQHGRCFYCENEMRKPGHVDHFVPWSKYPLDLGHNFVVAHQKCNSAKADHLAAADFLDAWAERNIHLGNTLSGAFDQRGVLHDLPTSARIANWAYQQTFDANGLTWERNNDMVPLPPDWERPILRLLEEMS